MVFVACTLAHFSHALLRLSAQEIYQAEKYRFEVDMFAFGVTLFRLLSGERPFPSNNSQILKRHTIELRYNVTSGDWDNISMAAKDLIRKLLINRQERLTAEDALAHPWFQEEGRSVLPVDLTHVGSEERVEGRSRATVRVSWPSSETSMSFCFCVVRAFARFLFLSPHSFLIPFLFFRRSLAHPKPRLFLGPTVDSGLIRICRSVSSRSFRPASTMREKW